MIIEGCDPYTQASFSLSNRLARLVWSCIESTFFRLSPRPFHRWRAFLLKVFGAKIGLHVHVYPGVRIWAPWNLRIDDYVGVADGVRIYNIAEVHLGERCVVSQGAFLCTGSHDIDSANFQLVAAPIDLGRHVWVCAEAFVGPGVAIAEGCVIAARAVVVKSIRDVWTVWAGNPVMYKRARNKNSGVF
jgi:putative colanic acid biosynthesis acetyltransferase WcaF